MVFTAFLLTFRIGKDSGKPPAFCGRQVGWWKLDYKAEKCPDQGNLVDQDEIPIISCQIDI